MSSTGGRTVEHTIFANRCSAGRQLAALLAGFRPQEPIILALPRGGVPVGYEVAHTLEAPLDVLVVRKILAPGRSGLVIGAVAPEVTVLDEETIALLDVPRPYIDETVERERRIAAWLRRSLRGDAPQPDVRGRTVIVVDDGLATGATALAALDVVRQAGAARAVVAAPVCAPEACNKLRARADDLVCVARPEDFRALACWYNDFTPVSDAEVRQILKLARLEREAHFHAAAVPT